MNKSAITVSFLVLLEILITSVFPGNGRATTLVKSWYLDHDQMKIRSNIESERQPKIAVVLSGGGARGLSHIGVFKALEEHGIPVHLVIGSSMGSVIGGLYASGYSPEQIGIIIKEIAWPEIFLDETERSTLFLAQKGEQDRYLISIRFKDFRPYIPNAISPGQKVLTILSELFLKAHYQPRNDFDNLKIPFRAVATDLVSGKRVVLKEGNLAECINGSLAIPLLFSPVTIDSMMLVDGGLLSNVPVDVAEELGADIVIAVDITAQLRPRTEMTAPWEIVDQVTTIMSEPVNRLQKGNADIVIKPALDDYLNTDFSQIDSMINAGYRAAGVHIGEIAHLIQRRKYHSDTTIHFTSREVPESLRENHRDVYDSLNMCMKNVLSLAEISGDLEKILSCGCYAQAAARIEDGEGIPSLILELTPFPDLDSVVFSGNSSLDDKQLRSVLTSKTGEQINAHTLSADLAAITELYRQQGFSLMTIRRSDLDFTSRQVILEIDEGVIDKIRIEGNHNTRDFVIRREFTLREGDVFNWINVNRSIKNIYATELFDRVGVDIIPEGDQTNLVIKVEEKSSIRMRLGGKIDNERRAQAYIEFGDDNLLGAGLRTTLLTRLGQRDGLVSLNMRSDRIFTTYLTFTVQSYYSWTINHIQGNNQSGRYKEDRVGLRFQLGQQLRRIGQLGAELRVERAKDEEYSGTFTLDQDLELRTLSLHSITDKRDRIDFPTSGIYNHWIWETGSKLFLQSQESYTKAALNLEGYYTVKTYHTWHIRFMTGVGDETVPFSETYRLGGLHSFFGLLENQYYGQQILQVNGEYRIKLPVHFMEGLYIGGRFDFGGIWEKPELLFDAEDFFTGIGGYLAVDTYLGPLYMGYGYMSDRRTAGYLSLGFNF